MIDKSFYDNLPKKRMAAGVLFFNDKEELLILKPSYKDHWTIPGGVINKNESPRRAAIREVKEEIGLDIPAPEFLCVSYVPDYEEKGESLQFLFVGGVLSEEQIKNIKIQKEEIIDYKFIKIDEVPHFISGNLGRRLDKCKEAFKNKTGIYLENEIK